MYRSVFLEFHLPAQSDSVMLSGDNRILEAIILVLIMNAFEATDTNNFEAKAASILDPQGFISSDTRRKVEIHIEADKNLHITVKDNGRGFTEDIGKKINSGEALNVFDEKPGSGLFLIRHFAETFNGSIIVKSDGPDQGANATFSCKLSSFEKPSSKNFPLMQGQIDLGNNI